MYGANKMKNEIVFKQILTRNLGGQFALVMDSQFKPKQVVNLYWNVVVNLTVYSKLTPKTATCIFFNFYKSYQFF
jgi:hypothetical protein